VENKIKSLSARRREDSNRKRRESMSAESRIADLEQQIRLLRDLLEETEARSVYNKYTIASILRGLAGSNEDEEDRLDASSSPEDPQEMD